MILLAAITPFAIATNDATDTQPESGAIYIDNQPADPLVYSVIINSTTYVSIRDFSMAMSADNVNWDNGTATITAPDLSITATINNIYLVANDRYLFVSGSCLMVNQRMMAPVRVLAKAFDSSVDWNAEEQAVYITKGSGAITSGSSYYDDTDLYWMARIISAEARGEIDSGKIAVGGVIMNRVLSPEFPSSVHNVIFDKRYGVQFTPAYSGAIYNTPTQDSIVAAKIALDGGNTVGDSLYFSSSSVGCWAARSRPFEMTIGHHSFYA